MELDELKQQLKQQIGNTGHHSARDISSMLQNQATSIIQKIERSLRVEFMLCILFTIGCTIAISLISSERYQLFIAFDGVLGLIVSGILGWLIWKTKQLGRSTLPVKNNLEAIISIIYRYVWLYFRVGIGFMPLFIGSAFWLSYYPFGGVIKPIHWEHLVYIIPVLALFSYLSFRFTKWYLKKLYGDYAEQLEQLLNEIEADEG